MLELRLRRGVRLAVCSWESQDSFCQTPGRAPGIQSLHQASSGLRMWLRFALWAQFSAGFSKGRAWNSDFSAITCECAFARVYFSVKERWGTRQSRERKGSKRMASTGDWFHPGASMVPTTQLLPPKARGQTFVSCTRCQSVSRHSQELGVRGDHTLSWARQLPFLKANALY